MYPRVYFDGGICIEDSRTKIFLDPQKIRYNCPFLITHAHLDHSAGFNCRDNMKISTKETREILSIYGKEVNNWHHISEGRTIEIGDLEVSAHNSGHILGSVLYEVFTSEGNVLYTGDFQYEDSFTMKGADPISCDILIIESTFGSPSFRFQDKEDVAKEMISWAMKTNRSGKVPTFKTDTLGNAQDIISAFNKYSDLPLVVHRKISEISEIYRKNGKKLDFLISGTDESNDLFSSCACAYIVPKNFDTENEMNLKPALVSGWALWARKYKDAFALSDHADFNQLMHYIEACNPKLVLTCFGNKRNSILADYVKKWLGIEARPIGTRPIEFRSRPENKRVIYCMKELDKALKIPGFVYSEKWILNEMKHQGFSQHDVKEALEKMTRRGFLESSVERIVE